MSEQTLGISDIALYLPPPKIEIETIVRERIRSKPELEHRLLRALDTTGQRELRFPEVWEDTSTMAAESSRLLLQQDGDLDIGRMRYLAVGTETPIDHSKAAAAYVEGMLQRTGIPVPTTISTFQVQHACAGGALAAISVLGLLAMSNRPHEAGLIACSDVARYSEATTAEITQGAGAASLLVEKDPKLVELDLSNVGFSSEDVDDFFRPLGSTVARVKGSYSMKCYDSSLETAFLDHCERRGSMPAQVLEATDYFVLHTPFRNMPVRAMNRLLKAHLGYSKEQAEGFLRERAFLQGIDPIARIGNTYTASLFMSLAFILNEQFRIIGNGIIGKRMLLASYGSGNTMAIISAVVAESAPSVLERWKLGAQWRSARSADMFEYDRWVGAPYERGRYNELVVEARNDVPAGSFYLSGIREDGYREYRSAE